MGHHFGYHRYVFLYLQLPLNQSIGYHSHFAPKANVAKMRTRSGKMALENGGV